MDDGLQFRSNPGSNPGYGKRHYIFNSFSYNSILEHNMAESLLALSEISILQSLSTSIANLNSEIPLPHILYHFLQRIRDLSLVLY